MFTEILKIDRLSYKGIRALQICVVVTFTLFIQEWLRYPNAAWTGFSVMMIYVGFDHGTTIFRAYHRFWGMILGLLTGFLLWLIGHIDYRLLILIIPTTIFFAYFLVGHAYSVPTIFTVNSAVIGTGYFAYDKTTTVNTFIYDYTAATIIAFIICVSFEYFWFRRYNLMKRFIEDTQHKIIDDLKLLINILNSDSTSVNKLFLACLHLNRDLSEVNQLVNNAEFEYSSEKIVGEEFIDFVTLANRIFIDIKALCSACFVKRYNRHDYESLFVQINLDLAALEFLVGRKEELTIDRGILDREN